MTPGQIIILNNKKISNNTPKNSNSNNKKINVTHKTVTISRLILRKKAKMTTTTRIISTVMTAAIKRRYA